MWGIQRFDCMTTPVWLQWVRASGLLHRSTDVPPTLEETSPTGTLPPRDSKTSLPKYQQTAEKGEKPFPVQVALGPATAHGIWLENVVCRMCGKSAVAGHSSEALMSCPSPNACSQRSSVNLGSRETQSWLGEQIG
eukprot:SAG22_NODE_1160_length_5317_cov_44.271560_6_plen_136_part_00